MDEQDDSPHAHRTAHAARTGTNDGCRCSFARTHTALFAHTQHTSHCAPHVLYTHTPHTSHRTLPTPHHTRTHLCPTPLCLVPSAQFGSRMDTDNGQWLINVSNDNGRFPSWMWTHVYVAWTNTPHAQHTLHTHTACTTHRSGYTSRTPPTTDLVNVFTFALHTTLLHTHPTHLPPLHTHAATHTTTHRTYCLHTHTHTRACPLPPLVPHTHGLPHAHTDDEFTHTLCWITQLRIHTHTIMNNNNDITDRRRSWNGRRPLQF